ncbi:MAG TPA: AI-2E family transporter [Polyangiaceae bacterium]|nr:AI-2E family transporter [Polyangiaceae bacterium]
MHTLSIYDREKLAPRVFAVMFFAAFVALAYVLKAFIADGVIAFILVGLFYKVYVGLVPKMFHSRWVASGVTTLLAFLVVVLPVLGVGYLIVTEAANAYGVLSNNILTQSEAQTVDQARQQLRELGFRMSRETVAVYVREAFAYTRDVAVHWVADVLRDTLALLGHLGIVLFMVFYMLVDGLRLRSFFFDLSPLPDDEDSLILSTFAKVSKGVIVGNGLGSLIQGLAGGLTMWAVGAKSPALWGCVMALFSFLPFVGVSAVMLPAAGYFYLQGHAEEAVTILVVCAVMTVFVEHVVKTKMIGSAMRMHDLLVFLTVIGGIGGFGLIGIIYGPLIAMLFITFADLYQSRYRPQLARMFAKYRASL